MAKIYVIGSLRSQEVQLVGKALRDIGWIAFDDWHGAGPEADDYWQKYEINRGRSYREALAGHVANHNFYFDKEHLDSSDAGILVLPAGKSAHLELGYLIGQGKPGYILMSGEPERYDLMYKFATGIFFSIEEMQQKLIREHN